MKKAAILFLLVLGLGTLWSSVQSDVGSFSDIQASLQEPSLQAWLGKDSLGRDLLQRVFLGAQVSLGLGLGSSVLAMILGVIYGGLSALSPRRVDSLLMRFSEVLMALPALMLMAVLVLILQTQVSGSHLPALFGALTLGAWMPVSKLTRNLILQEKGRDYVEAARALGAGRCRIFLRHIFPNISSPLLVFWSLQVPHAILSEGILSFLGFGVKSPNVSWGALMQEGWKTLASYPHLLLGPSLFLFLTVLSLNILLESFRKNLDPKLRWEKFS